MTGTVFYVLAGTRTHFGRLLPLPQSVQRFKLIINYEYPLLSQGTKKRHIPPENTHVLKMARGGEGLFLVHWLSYEKLNVCILCASILEEYPVIH